MSWPNVTGSMGYRMPIYSYTTRHPVSLYCHLALPSFPMHPSPPCPMYIPQDPSLYPVSSLPPPASMCIPCQLTVLQPHGIVTLISPSFTHSYSFQRTVVLKMVPGLTASPANLLEMQILGPYHRLTESESLRVVPRSSCFKKPLGDSGARSHLRTAALDICIICATTCRALC